MKTIITFLIAALIVTASAVPDLLNYQGKLLDPATSEPLADGPHTLVFNFHDAATDGNILWGPFSMETNTSNGFFNVILGPADDAAPARELKDAFTASDNVFLSIAVDGGAALEPRQQILSSPFAFNAARADEAALSTQSLQSATLTGSWNVPAGQKASINIGGSETFIVSDPPSIGIPIRAALKDGHIAVDPGYGIFSFDSSSPRAINAGMDTSPAGEITFYSFGGQKVRLTEDRLMPFKNATNTVSNGSNFGMFLGDSSHAWKAVYARHGTIRPSDERLKTNIEDLDYGLNEVLELRPTRYNWKTAPDDENEIGLIAQELQTIIPEAVDVGTDKDKTLGVTYTDLIPVLIKGMQEQQAQIEELKAQLEALEQATKR